MEWVKKGASNKVIARRLGMCESTVKAHMGEIFRRYGVSNRTQLAMSSTHNQEIVIAPIELEPDPVLWVYSSGRDVTGISTKAIDGWEPLYRKAQDD
jgi:hypothetical protein